MRTEVRRLAAIPDVESVSSQPGRQPPCATEPPHEWICELELPVAAPPATRCWNTRSATSGGLRELRILGMRPEVAILDATEAVDARRSGDSLARVKITGRVGSLSLVPRPLTSIAIDAGAVFSVAAGHCFADGTNALVESACAT